jgi:hypothetical protein
MEIMNKIKLFLKNIWTYLILSGTVIIGILLWLLNIKNKELEAAKAQIQLVQTQKDADLIETDINKRLAEEQLSNTQRAGLQQSLKLLEEKRNTLTDPRTTNQAKADYWDNQK